MLYSLATLKAVLANYPVHVKSITPETLKKKKAVWWVSTKDRKFVVKKVPVTRDRLLFLLSAADHLRKNGVNIPAIIPTSGGSLFAEHNGEIYILMDAVDVKAPSYNVNDLALIMREMARFHRASTKYAPPPGAKIRSHLGNWHKYYGEMVTDLESYREAAQRNPQGLFEKLYLSHCDRFINRGKECLANLEKHPYSNWVKKVSREINLCHQDFAAANLGLSKGSLYVYDLDSITFDLPARDIRKIFNKVMKKRGRWDPVLAVWMLGSYQKVNPLSVDEYSVVFIDIMFPYLFHGISSKYFENREARWNNGKFLSRLREMIDVEESKVILIKKQEEIIRSVVSTVRSKRGGVQN